MKSTLMKAVAITAVIVVAAGSFAQGGRGGGGGQGGRGGFGQGGMMMGGGMQQGPLFLLRDANVQADLGLTTDQQTKLQALQPGRGGAGGGGGRGGAGGGQGMSAEERQKQQEELNKQINSILTSQQQARLKEIRLQLAGNRAIMDPEFQKDLEVTDAQKAKIQDLQQKQREAMQGLFQRVQNQEISREDLQAAMQRSNETMNTELGKIMTPEQAAKLKTMQGTKPFKGLAPRAPGGGGRGGSTGGGGF